MSELPKGWVTARLGDLIVPRGDKANPTRLPDMPFIGLEDVEANTGRVLTMQTTSGLKSSVSLFMEGDLLYGRLRPYLNKVVIATFSGAASAEFIILPPVANFEQKYLQHILMSPSFIHFNGMRSTGDRPRISFDAIADYEFPVPPSPEQRRIIAKIDNLTAKSKRARDHLDHIPRLVEQYKQAVLTAAFRGDLTRKWRSENAPSISASEYIMRRQRVARDTSHASNKGRDEKSAQLIKDCPIEARNVAADTTESLLPNGWCWTQLGVVFGVYVGATPSRKNDAYWSGRINWVSSGEVAFCRIKKTSETISIEGLRNASTRVHPPGTVLLGMIGEGKTRGQAAIIDIPACNNQNCAAIRVSEADYSADYIYYYLMRVYEETRLVGTGNNQPALNKERVQKLTIPLAPPDEAMVVAQSVSSIFAWIDRLASEATSARKLIDKFEQTIRANALRGALVPQDPNDEPASVILDRIRAERAETPKIKRGRKPRVA